jgi:hypothetical protein
MKKPWENDSCEHVQSYYTIYPVPVAAALWCGIPPNEIQEHLDASTQVYRAVYRHPYIRCLEPRCRAMHEAIEKGALLVSREDGKSFDGRTDHVAPERRHVTRQNLKEWIAREFPADKPAFLFDEIERKTHAAINADAFRALQADRDAARAELEEAKAELEEAKAWAAATIREMEAMRGNLSTKEEVALGRRKQQFEIILAVVAALEYEPLQIPDGGKAKIKTACLKRPALFTDSSFDHAWKQAVSDGLVRMENHDKFI